MAVCTVLILALVGGMIYWGYTAFQAEQAMTQARMSAPAQTTGARRQSRGPGRSPTAPRCPCIFWWVSPSS